MEKLALLSIFPVPDDYEIRPVADLDEMMKESEQRRRKEGGQAHSTR